MNSRQRLLKVLDREPVDRVPISTYELCGYNSLAFENNEPSYKGLMDFIREYTDCVCMWNPASNEKAALSAYPVEVSKDKYRKENCSIIREVLHTPKGALS